MTPLEADKLNKELIECKRKLDNKSKMVIDLARDAVKNDQEIDFLKAENAIAERVIYIWRILFGLVSVLALIILFIKTHGLS